MTTAPPSPAPDPRRVVVIGAGPGLGAAVARRFTREGSAVALVARSADALEELAVQLRRTAPGVVVYDVGLVATDQLLTSSPRYLLDALAVDVVGIIAPGTDLDPDLLAEHHWQLHTEPVGAWSTGVVVGGS